MLMNISDAIATNGMLAAGYVWFNLDDGFIASRDANGTVCVCVRACMRRCACFCGCIMRRSCLCSVCGWG